MVMVKNVGVINVVDTLMMMTINMSTHTVKIMSKNKKNMTIVHITIIVTVKRRSTIAIINISIKQSYQLSKKICGKMTRLQMQLEKQKTILRASKWSILRIKLLALNSQN